VEINPEKIAPIEKSRKDLIGALREILCGCLNMDLLIWVVYPGSHLVSAE